MSTHFGMFDFGLCCVVGPYDKVEPFIRWKFDDPGFTVVNRYAPRGRFFFRPGYVPVIWLPRVPRTPRDYGTMAHEILHAVCALTDWAGVRLASETEEVFCHALGHAMTDLLAQLRRAT